MYTFLTKLCLAETQAFLAMNRTLGLSIRKQLLKKEHKRDINMLRKLWPPNEKGRKANYYREMCGNDFFDPIPSHSHDRIPIPIPFPQ